MPFFLIDFLKSIASSFLKKKYFFENEGNPISLKSKSVVVLKNIFNVKTTSEHFLSKKVLVNFHIFLKIQLFLLSQHIYNYLVNNRLAEI